MEDQYDLRWPTSQERDFTQIITEDTATKSNINCDPDGRQEKELKQCPEQSRSPSLRSEIVSRGNNATSYPGSFHYAPHNVFSCIHVNFITKLF